GDVREADRVALLQAVAGDGRREVRLAAAVLPEEDQPALGLPGPVARQLERALQVAPLLAAQRLATGTEGLEGVLSQAVSGHCTDVEVSGHRLEPQLEDLRERGVREAGTEARVDLAGRTHAGEDRGQRRVEAV